MILLGYKLASRNYSGDLSIGARRVWLKPKFGHAQTCDHRAGPSMPIMPSAPRENWRPIGQARSILLVVTGGKSPDEAAVWEYGWADRCTAAADWIGAAVGKRTWRNQEKTEKGGRNRFKISQLLVFLNPEGARLLPSWAAGFARDGKYEKTVQYEDAIGCKRFGA